MLIRKGDSPPMTSTRKLLRARLAPIAVALLALGAILGVAACGGDDDSASGSSSDSGGGNVDLVAYSTPQQAFEEGIIPGFQETDKGSGTDFSTSFASSGEQRDAVLQGKPADFVDLSL